MRQLTISAGSERKFYLKDKDVEKLFKWLAKNQLSFSDFLTQVFSLKSPKAKNIIWECAECGVVVRTLPHPMRCPKCKCCTGYSPKEVMYETS